MYQILILLIVVFINFIKTLFKSKEELILVNLSLRHQLGVYQTKNPQRINCAKKNGNSIPFPSIKTVFQSHTQLKFSLFSINTC
jgi:hypothetical protein